MYCGSNKTALQSQRQISRAMMALIQEKPFAQISVSELCKAAGISRQTFYSLFTSRENVMVFTLQAQYCDGPEIAEAVHACRGEGALQALCEGYSDYIIKNQALIKLLVDNRIDYLLYDSFFEALNQCDCIWSQMDPCTRGYAASFYAGGIACVARRYAQEGCATTADRLEALLMRLLSGSML